MTPEEAKAIKPGDTYYHVGVLTGEISEHTMTSHGDGRIRNGWLKRLFTTREEAEMFVILTRLQK